MKRKIFAVAVMLLSLAVGAAAAEVTLKADNRNISVISGESSVAENTKLTVSIFSDDNSYQEMLSNGENEVEILPFVSVIQAGENGKFSIEWENKKSGEYTIYVASGRGNAEGYPKKIFITSKMEDKYNAVKSGTKEELEAIFAESTAIREFTGGNNTSVKDGSKTGTALFNVRESFTSNENAEDYIDLAILINALSDTPVSANLDAVISELKEKGIEFNNYALYNSSLSNVKDEMAKAFSGGQDMALTEWADKLDDEIVLSGVYKAATYLDAMDYLDTLNNAKYNQNKTAVATAVVGKKYNTVAELEAAIANAPIMLPYVSTGGGGGGGGGGSNRPASSGGITGASSSAVTPSVEVKAEQSVFKDVWESHWAFDAINYLHWKEIVSGDEKNNFNPDSYITRAETVKLLCLAFEFEVMSDAGQSFSDVGKEEWFFDYVNTLKAQNLVKGDFENCFNPENNITREDLSVLIYRILEKKGLQPEASKNGFTDEGTVSDYAYEAVSKLAGGGIINGFSDGSFKPHANATRAETATVIYRILTGQ